MITIPALLPLPVHPKVHAHFICLWLTPYVVFLHRNSSYDTKASFKWLLHTWNLLSVVCPSIPHTSKTHQAAAYLKTEHIFYQISPWQGSGHRDLQSLVIDTCFPSSLCPLSPCSVTQAYYTMLCDATFKHEKPGPHPHCCSARITLHNPHAPQPSNPLISVPQESSFL